MQGRQVSLKCLTRQHARSCSHHLVLMVAFTGQLFVDNAGDLADVLHLHKSAWNSYCRLRTDIYTIQAAVICSQFQQ